MMDEYILKSDLHILVDPNNINFCCKRISFIKKKQILQNRYLKYIQDNLDKLDNILQKFNV